MTSVFDFVNIYALLGCAEVLFWYYSQSTYSFWRKLNVKYLEPVPLFGNFSKILLRLTTFHEGYDQLYKALDKEPYVGFYQIRQPRLLVKDPELVTDILTRNFKHFQSRGGGLVMTNRNKKLNPLSAHLFFTDGERWKVLRQKMSPVFTSGKLKQMHDQMLACVHSLFNYIDERMDGHNSTDMALKVLFERLTMDVIGTCAFGIDCNSSEKFGQMGREFFKPRISQVFRIILFSISSRFSNFLKIGSIPRDITDFFLNLTWDTMEYRRKNGVTRHDVLQLFMELQNSYVDPKFALGDKNKNVLTSENFDEIDIAANSFLFFIAGFETTASTLSYCFYELALNQDIQDKLRNEVQQIKNNSSSHILTYDSLKEMIYMDAIISETLRKYPPVGNLNRECTEDYVIPGTETKIPAGTTILIPVWSIHHDWKNYPNPEVFDPERFMGDNKNLRSSGVYLPFGEGPRYCLGKRFAEIEIKATLSEMILRYDFRPCAKTKIPLKFKTGSVILQTTCGTWVNLEKRK